MNLGLGYPGSRQEVFMLHLDYTRRLHPFILLAFLDCYIILKIPRITKLTGLFGWGISGADPKAYEQNGMKMGWMTLG